LAQLNVVRNLDSVKGFQAPDHVSGTVHNRSYGSLTLSYAKASSNKNK